MRPYVYFGYGYGSMENVYYDGEGLFSSTNLVANGSIFNGIELGAKFYLLDSVIFEGSGYSPLMSVENIPMMGLIFQSIDLNSTKTTMRRPFALTASYVYHF